MYSKLVLSNRTAAEARDLVEVVTREEWAANADTVAYGADVEAKPRGTTLGFLYIPRLRPEVWGFPIVEGTNPKQLTAGVGHLLQTALPGEDGNVAMFGHRTAYGKPFDRFNELVKGDKVVIETQSSWYVYTLVASAKVEPSAMWVAKPNPFANGTLKGSIPNWKTMPKQVVSLITCTPKFSTDMRWVWWGTQTSVSDHSAPPSIVTAT
jgi:sortase A